MKLSHAPALLGNQKGQMAIFIAIIFQVLFVLFAMSINVALVVHDKVNLQNATDLAAYYAAQKQAELLNVMAHQNYQIRQSWKLLSWRYRFLGQFGIGGEDYSATKSHPARRVANFVDENIFIPNPRGAGEVAQITPAVCMGYGPQWSHVSREQNICKSRDAYINLTPQVREYPGITAIIQQTLVNRQINNSYRVIQNDCNNIAAFNYIYGASIMLGFRLDQKNRKEVIYGIANNLSQEGNNFYDLNGDSVFAGVTKMVKNNLTFASTEGEPSIELYNSLSGVKVEDWLSEQAILPSLLYVYPKQSDCASAGRARHIAEAPNRDNVKSIIDRVDLSGALRTFSEMENINNIYQYSLGVEKNPWQWVYSGVKATRQIRPLFFPFGEPLTITAKSFAKPFGGRIGPWYRESWKPGDKSSSGEKTDILIAPRVLPGSVDLAAIKDEPNRFPNYARFPGDKKGLTSNLALNSLERAGYFQAESILNYVTVLQKFWDGEEDDITYFDYRNNQPSRLGELEVSALAPDLFDVTYYSIDPHFSRVYLNKLRENKNSILKAGQKVSDISQVKIRGDLGSKQKLDSNPTFGVNDQITLNVKNKKTESFYFIKEKAHLLTAWLHGEEALNFTPANVKPWFSNCSPDGFDDERSYFVPGSCAVSGGRTGYSVKLFSQGIFDEKLPLGGAGSEGVVANRPPSGW